MKLRVLSQHLHGRDFQAGQLTNENIVGAGTTAWTYDEAGNWLNADASTKWVYNADNEIAGRISTGSSDTTTTTVSGTVDPGPKSNKWYSSVAELRGNTTTVDSDDGTFSFSGVKVYPGHNAFVVNVTDVSGNTATEVRTAVRSSGVSEYFGHDLNGNLTNWVSGSQNWVYEWDSADRLTKVSSNGVVLLQNWYDANSRRIAKQEVVAGVTKKWIYLYDGWDIVGVMNGTGALQETFTRGVGLAGDIGTLVAVTRHTTPNAGTHYTHHNHRGDIVMVRSGTTTSATYPYSAFGKLTASTGTDLSRFKFSSKERETTCGFSYYGYRYYAPEWQRWLSRDPIGEPGGANLYGFVQGDSVNKVDPLGLKDRQECFFDCKREATCAMVGIGSKAAKNNALGLGTGIITTGVGLAIGSRLGVVPAVFFGGIGTSITLFQITDTMNDRQKIATDIRTDYLQCLVDCQRKFPRQKPTAREFIEDYPLSL